MNFIKMLGLGERAVPCVPGLVDMPLTAEWAAAAKAMAWRRSRPAAMSPPRASNAWARKVGSSIAAAGCGMPVGI